MLCEAAFEVALEPEAAARLFTAEGEREWVEGWDPRYPGGAPGEQHAGTVFITGPGGQETVWVVAETGQLGHRYARLAPDGVAALVDVRCTAAGAGTSVEVRYELTAVREGAEADVSEFAQGFDEYLAGWKKAIDEALERRSG